MALRQCYPFKVTLSYLKKLDICNSALRFVIGATARTCHCNLYDMVQWPSLKLRRKFHSLVFIATALMSKLPQYICNLITLHANTCSTHSSEKLLCSLTTWTELSKSALWSYATHEWNSLQNILNLDSLPSRN